MKLETEFLNSGIFIIDGLKDNELQTGRRLSEDIAAFKGFSDSPSIEYKRVSTKNEVFVRLDEIKEYCKQGGYPIIHFEVHGGKEGGVYIGNEEENIPWSELVEVLREINIISRNNLGVVMAGCYGLYAIVPTEPLRPTPFYFLLGCDRSIGAGTLEENIARFYQELFKTGSLTEAMKVVDSFFATFLAEKEFTIAMIMYFRDQARGKGKDKRVETTLTEWVRRNPGHTEEELKEFRSRLKTLYKPSIDEFYRNANIFLHGRFSVDADEVLTFLDTLHGPSPN
jgi:hypothetical protein